MNTKYTVRVKGDSRPETWAVDKANAMHAALADKADRSAESEEKRAEAYKERHGHKAGPRRMKVLVYRAA